MGFLIMRLGTSSRCEEEMRSFVKAVLHSAYETENRIIILKSSNEGDVRRKSWDSQACFPNAFEEHTQQIITSALSQLISKSTVSVDFWDLDFFPFLSLLVWGLLIL